MKKVTKRVRKLASTSRSSVKLFISYSHANRIWMKRLRVFVEGFQYDDRRLNWSIDSVHAWHDNELSPGNPWDGEIRTELHLMDIFVPLISPDFFSSWYIQNVELPIARDRFHSERAILVVPIMIYEVNLQQKCSFLNQFSSLPTCDRCWKSFRDPNEAYRLIDDGLWSAIKCVHDGKQNRG